MNKPDIEIQRAAELQHIVYGTELRLIFKGTDVDRVLVNTLRQVVYSEIPVYGISRSSSIIEKNSSIDDDNIMRQRLSMIPIRNVDCKVDFLEPVNYPYVNDMTGKIYPEKEHLRDAKDDVNINLFANITNDGKVTNGYDETNIMYVTTNDITITVDGKETKDMYDHKYPLLIIKLKVGQSFSFNSKAQVGIAKLHSCWDAISQCTYLQMDTNMYGFIIKSLGQRTEWNCLTVGCNIIINKITRLKKDVTKKYKQDESKEITLMIIKIEKEEHMMGNLLSSTLIKHPDIVSASYKIDHPFIQEVTLLLDVKKGKSPINVFNYVCDFIVDTYTLVKKKLDKAEKEKFKPNEILIAIKEKKPRKV